MQEPTPKAAAIDSDSIQEMRQHTKCSGIAINEHGKSTHFLANRIRTTEQSLDIMRGNYDSLMTTGSLGARVEAGCKQEATKVGTRNAHNLRHCASCSKAMYSTRELRAACASGSLPRRLICTGQPLACLCQRVCATDWQCSAQVCTHQSSVSLEMSRQ